MQKFFRIVIGTNNIDGCARVCHAPTAMGMQWAYGTGAATNSIEELYKTGCILDNRCQSVSSTPGHRGAGSKRWLSRERR